MGYKGWPTREFRNSGWSGWWSGIVDCVPSDFRAATAEVEAGPIDTHIVLNMFAFYGGVKSFDRSPVVYMSHRIIETKWILLAQIRKKQQLHGFCWKSDFQSTNSKI
jgi:hypothetical protein